MNLNLLDYVYVQTNANHEKLAILVDSQADVCVLKQSMINNNLNVDETEIIYIKGVTNELISSIGTILIKIHLQNNIQISHKFHIVPDDFAIPSDGIIGKDFMKLYQCILFGLWRFDIHN